jgi:hypothetical protein
MRMAWAIVTIFVTAWAAAAAAQYDEQPFINNSVVEPKLCLEEAKNNNSSYCGASHAQEPFEWKLMQNGSLQPVMRHAKRHPATRRRHRMSTLTTVHTFWRDVSSVLFFFKYKHE